MPRSDTDTELPLFIDGRYRLEELLGRGGAGEVWAATDTVLGRRVALKLLRGHLRGDTTTAERFRREATAAAGLAHRSVVTIYDVGDADDAHPFLVMELVDGPSLADVLAGGPVDEATAVALGCQVAGALGAAHDQGLVHRDIKPANILISRTGIAKVADFGVAKALGGSAATLTGHGTVVGTAAYLAPEQAAGEDTGPPVDVYALGLALWELLAGRSPFGGATIGELFARRLSTDVPPLPDDVEVSDELANAIRTATRRAPGERFPNGNAFAAALAPMCVAHPEPLLADLAETRSGRARPDRTAVLEHTIAHDALGTTRVIGEVRDPDATEAIPAVAPPRPARTVEPTREPRPATPHDSGPAEPRQHRRDVEPTVDADDDDRDHHRPWLPIVIAAVLVIGLLALLGRGGSEDDGEAQPQPTEAAPVAIADGGDHDPFGDREHPEDVPAAFDGDASTAWTTQRYESADFGGLKGGVGMWVDLGEAAEIGRVELDLGIPGAAIELYAMDEAPGGDPAAWGEAVGTLGEAPSATVIDLEQPTAARYWLVWLTSLPEDGGRYRTTIEELRLFPEG